MAEGGQRETAGLALLKAAAAGHLPLVSALLADGAPVEGVCGEPRTPVQAAAEEGHEQVVAVLIEAGANLEAVITHDADKRPLHLASRRGCVEVVRRLLRAGADIQARMTNGYTPLHEASYAGQVETVQLLLEAGADIENSDVDGGWRPLHRAALWGWPEVIDVLLDAGADIEAETTSGYRPIHCAAMRGHVSVLEALVERGCQTYTKDRYGSSALHHAVGGGQLKTVQWLVVRGCIAHDARNGENRTPEELAHFYGYHDVAWWLHKLNVDALPSKHEHMARVLEEHERIGNISLKWAQDGKHDSLSDQLPFRPWRIHYQDSRGWTPLHHAAFNNKEASIKELVKLGALPLSCTYKQETPADLARSRGHTDLARLLTVTPPYLTLSERVELFEQLLNTISLAENQTEDNISDEKEKSLRLSCVQKISELVMKGTPLEPTGGHNIYPLHLAISSNRNHLLPLLLCAGAPLTSTADGLSVLQQAWLSQDVTTNVGVVITRAVMHRLKFEREFERDQILLEKPEDKTYHRLLDGISHLIRSLEGNQPWQASWPSIKEENLGETARFRHTNPDAGAFQSSIHSEEKDNHGRCKNSGTDKTFKISCKSDSKEKGIAKEAGSDDGCWKDLTDLLDRACGLGATLTASFLKRSGACVSWCGASGRTALHAALDAQHWDTAVALVRDMGANIFLQDDHGRLPLTLCPPHLRTRLLQDALSRDYRSLDHLLSKAHDSSEKQSTIHVMLLLATLYINSKEGTNSTEGSNSKEGTNSTEGSNSKEGNNSAEGSNSKEGNNSTEGSNSKEGNNSTEGSNSKEGTNSTEGSNSKEGNNSAEGSTSVTTNNGTGRDQGMGAAAPQSTTDCLKTNDNWKTSFVYLASILREGKEDSFTSSAWLENLLACLSDPTGQDEEQVAMGGKGVTSEDELLSYTKTARNEERTTTEEYMFFQLVEKLSQVMVQVKGCNVEQQQLINTTLMKALLISCKNGLTTLLHLLLTVGGVGIDMIVDEVSGSTALHVAAAQGRPGLCDFLLSRQASTTALDRAGRTPAHLAYMFGHSSTGDRLVAWVENFKDKANNSPRKLLEGFMKYTETYMLSKNLGIQSHEQNDETSLIRAHLCHFQRRWRGNIEKAVRRMHVDFTRGEAREVKEVLTRELSRILEKLEKVNPLFASSLQVLGSSADNLRLYAPDEFDCNVVLKNISGFHAGGLSVSLEQLSHKEASEKCCNFSLRVTATKDELKTLVSGSNFVNMFFEALSRCLTSFEPSDPRLGFVLPGVRKTQVGANVSFAWEGSEFPLLLIDVDLVPVVEVPWPQQLDRPPLTPSTINSFHISSTGDDNWRCSFAAVENQIFRELSPERRLVLLACKLLVVTLKVESWAPKDIKEQHTYWIGHRFKIPAPAGFILKSSFLREMEEVKDNSLWEAPRLMERIKSVFQRMCKSEDYSSNSDNNQMYYLSQVKAYFGGECEKPTVGYSAPEILRFLESW